MIKFVKKLTRISTSSCCSVPRDLFLVEYLTFNNYSKLIKLEDEMKMKICWEFKVNLQIINSHMLSFLWKLQYEQFHELFFSVSWQKYFSAPKFLRYFFSLIPKAYQRHILNMNRLWYASYQVECYDDANFGCDTQKLVNLIIILAGGGERVRFWKFLQNFDNESQ